MDLPEFDLRWCNGCLRRRPSNSGAWDGRNCPQCKRRKAKEWHDKVPGRSAEYSRTARERARTAGLNRDAEYYERNKERIRERERNRYQETRAQLTAYHKLVATTDGRAEYNLRMRVGHWRRKGYLNSDGSAFTWDDYERLDTGNCHLCGTNSPGGRGAWVVDHNHETGIVRGLLCNTCNSIVVAGLDIAIAGGYLDAAIAYAKRNG